MPVVDKDGTVTIGDAELIDAQGRVYEWNGSELVDQDGNAAVEDQELIDAQGRVWTWNGTYLEPKSTRVTVDTSSIENAKTAWRNATFPAKVTRVAVQGNTWGELTHAEGGVIPGGSTRGFIATGPTNVDGTNIVGEAGAEAVFDYGGSSYIVPLTNKTYSAPFADVIAQQVSKYLGSAARPGRPSYMNITIDGTGTTARVQQIALELLDELEREARI